MTLALGRGPRVRSYYVGLANEWHIHKARTLPATLQGFPILRKILLSLKYFFHFILYIKSQYPALCTMYLKLRITKYTANVICVHISSQPS